MRPDTYRVGLIQMDSQADKPANLLQAGHMIERAVELGARLVALPEVFNQIGEVEPEREDGASVSFLRETARRHAIYLHGGSFLMTADAGKPTNTTLLFNPAGDIIARYDKLHLFDVSLPDGSTRGESDDVAPGRAIVSRRTELGHLGLSICYDIRFPEVYRQLALAGAEVIFVPANFTLLTGKDHWEVLLRARAIENGCYIVAPAQIGRKKDHHFSFGESMVIDPWGRVIARGRERADVIVSEIDLSDVARVRSMIPVFNHRRSDIY